MMYLYYSSYIRRRLREGGPRTLLLLLSPHGNRLVYEGIGTLEEPNRPKFRPGVWIAVRVMP